ncbi:RNA-binding protein [Candidatus Woesearchaeota archaeon]|nr:RNA-binding protein [Candidatus Woesearchaeota archaeon]
MEDIVCISCRKKVINLDGTAKFMCPSCGKAEIIRCGHCREIVTKYKCPQCGFEGPN